MSDKLDRIEATLDQQLLLNAQFRTELEILKNAVESQRAEIGDLKSAAESILQFAQLNRQDLLLLASVVQQHRTDPNAHDS
jgi:hypothetical protein